MSEVTAMLENIREFAEKMAKIESTDWNEWAMSFNNILTESSIMEKSQAELEKILENLLQGCRQFNPEPPSCPEFQEFGKLFLQLYDEYKIQIPCLQKMYQDLLGRENEPKNPSSVPRGDEESDPSVLGTERTSDPSVLGTERTSDLSVPRTERTSDPRSDPRSDSMNEEKPNEKLNEELNETSPSKEETLTHFFQLATKLVSGNASAEIGDIPGTHLINLINQLTIDSTIKPEP